VGRKVKVLVSTHPFGKADPRSAEMIVAQGWELEFNPYGRKITQEELKVLLPEVDALIAGTERLDADVLRNAGNLKLISRVGIGLDGIDWDEVQRRGIEVAYTPDAPTRSVAELTVGLMLDLARGISRTSRSMHEKEWHRYTGCELRGKTVGIIGFGRVGKSVASLLRSFECRLLANDIRPDRERMRQLGVIEADKDEIYRTAQFVTLHVPLTDLTRHLINADALKRMRTDVCLINTSRGPVVDEQALFKALSTGIIRSAALDVYAEEPYAGPLTELENIVLTCHMGSCTEESRAAMETEAAQAVIDFFLGRPLKNRVPDELRIQTEG